MSNGPALVAAPGNSVSKRTALIVVMVANFLTPFMGSAVNVAFPTMAREFGVGAITLTWISTAYLLAAAMFLIPLGKLADIHGRKRVFLLGVTGYTLMSLLCSLATSETMLITARALQGVTDAMMFGTASAILTSVYPAKERGRAFGAAMVAVYGGGASGPFIGGLLTQYLGWRSIFYLTAILGLVAVILIVTKLRGEWAEARGQKLDLVGSALYALTLLAVMYGLTLLPAIQGLGLVAAGVVGLILFVGWETRVAQPVLDVRLFRHNTVFALSNLSALINYTATAAIAFLLSLFLQYVKGVPPNVAGLILLSQPVMMALFSPLAGRTADRIEPRFIASAGMALVTIGLWLIALLSPATSLGFVFVPLVICGLGFALFSSPNQTAIMGSVDRQFFGVASAMTSAMRLIGQMMSLGIVTVALSLFVGNAQITPDRYPAFLQAFRLVFTASGLLCFGGIFASLARGNIHTQSALPPVTSVAEGQVNLSSESGTGLGR
jgi:EmrB/QacA subfamily drug resistance transporter